jgi:hypothetical protein
MRGPQTLLLEDQETGLKLYREQRSDLDGNPDFIFVFEVTPPRGLPNIGPGDKHDGKAAARAFYAFVEWLKANP